MEPCSRIDCKSFEKTRKTNDTNRFFSINHIFSSYVANTLRASSQAINDLSEPFKVWVVVHFRRKIRVSVAANKRNSFTILASF